MSTRPIYTPLAAAAAAVLALSLAACGGGNGEAPPQPGGSTVTGAAPVVTMTNSVTADTATGPMTVTFSFNRDVGTSFTADDVTVTGGTKGAFARVSGTSATLVITPTANASGTMMVTVAAGAVTDAVGTANAAATLSKAFDTVIPVVQTRLVTFDETTAPVLTGFGGAENATVVADPTNPANKVAQVVKSATAQVWAGVTVSICPSQALVALPFTSTNRSLTARVWSPTAGTPVRLKVEDASDGTKSVETEAITTQANAWQTLTFNFANQAAGTAALNLATMYNKASIFFNFGTDGASAGARTYYLDDLAFLGSNFAVACPAPPTTGGTTTITMDEATAPVLTGFGGAEGSTIVADPTNAANKVARVVKDASAQLWAGTTVSNLPNQAIAPIGFTATNRTVTLRVWSPTAGTPVRLKVESATDNTKSVETEATTTVAGGWQTLSFNFANQAAGTAALNLATVYDKASVFFNFGTTGAAAGGARTYYFDDLVYPTVSTTPPATGSNVVVTMDESTAPVLTGFGGAEDATVVADPTNAANKVARVIKNATAEVWAGTTFSNLPNLAVARIGFATGSTVITVRVWSPTAGTVVRLKAEDAADNTKTVETDATTTVAGGWQTMSFNFANQATGTAALNLATNFNKLSIFFNFGTGGVAAGGARTYYFEDVTYPAVATTGGGGGTSSFAPITFDAVGTTYTLTGFGGAEDATLQNDPAGGTGKVARVIKSATAETWGGTTFSTGANLSITRVPLSATARTMTVRVYAPATGKVVRLKLEDAADATKTVETDATTTVANGWQTLTFNFGSPAAGTNPLNVATNFNKASIFFNFGTGGAAGAGTWYFDDVTYVP